MARIVEYRAIWDVPGGGTGYTVLHYLDGTPGQLTPDIGVNLVTAFYAIRSHLPNDVTISFDNEARVLDSTNGQLLAAYPVTPSASISGQSSTPWAAAAGARVVWDTGEIVNGRRLRGRTYLVPLAQAAYDTDGTLSPAFIDKALEFGEALAQPPLPNPSQLVVWSRSSGVALPVVGWSCPDKTAILRSRRD